MRVRMPLAHLMISTASHPSEKASDNRLSTSRQEDLSPSYRDAGSLFEQSEPSAA